MDERKEKPITDEENFPVAEGIKIAPRLVVPIEQVAYSDGLCDGYRDAIKDIMLWALAFFVMAILARSIYQET